LDIPKFNALTFGPFNKGGADKILDYVEVVHVFIRRSNSSR
jgi:hypothetical protein